MVTPAGHESLTDRAKRVWAHIHHLGLLLAVLGIVFVVVEVGLAIKHWGETRQTEQVAADVKKSPAERTPDAELRDSAVDKLLGRYQSKLEELSLKSRRTVDVAGGKIGEPRAQQPAPAISPGGTKEIPHPEETTKTAQYLPEATVYKFKTQKEEDEEAERFSIDFTKFFPVTQRKEILAERCRYGCYLMGFIAAGGGQVFIQDRSIARPKTDFHQVFWVGTGVFGMYEFGNETTAQPRLPFTYGPLVHLGLEPARLGDAHIKLETFQNYAAVGPKKNRLLGTYLVYVDFKFGSND